MSAKAAHCPKCGAAAGADDVFCGDCGGSLKVATPTARQPVAPRHASPQAKKRKRKWLFRGIVLAGLLGAGWFFFLRPAAYTPPQRSEPNVPPAVAGTMREFPVDTDPNEPAQLTSLVSQNFPSGEGPEEVSVPAEQLPPGVSPSDLPRYGTAVTSGQYRTPAVPDPVNVHVIETGNNPGAGQQITQAVSQATGGERTGIEVQSPQGGTYRGERIQTSEIVIHILINQQQETVIIVYAPTPAAQPMGQRLAGNVGNGGGVLTQPGMQQTLWALPRELPFGFILEAMTIATPGDLGLDPSMMPSDGPGIDPEIGQYLGSIDHILPQRFVAARYRDELGSKWNVLVCDFDSVRKAQNLWWLLSWTVGSQMLSVEVSGVTGLTVEADGEGQVLLFQKGPYVVAIMAPPNNTMELIRLFGQSLQI